MKPITLVELDYGGCPPCMITFFVESEEELAEAVKQYNVPGEKGSSPPYILSLDCYKVEEGDELVIEDTVPFTLAGSVQTARPDSGRYNVLYKDLAGCWHMSLWMNDPYDPLLKNAVENCKKAGNECFLIMKKEDADVVGHN